MDYIDTAKVELNDLEAESEQDSTSKNDQKSKSFLNLDLSSMNREELNQYKFNLILKGEDLIDKISLKYNLSESEVDMLKQSFQDTHEVAEFSGLRNAKAFF